MNETPVDRTAPGSDSGKSRSQSHRLCQACLSVLARNDLEITKLYAHHNDLKGFVEANRTRCYICSWIFADLPRDSQEQLRLLAEGKIPDNFIVREAEEADDLSKTANVRNYIRHDWIMSIEGKWHKGVPWASFTSLKIEPDFSYRNHMKVLVLLNPLYGGYFPLTTTVYDSWLRVLWEGVRICMSRSILKPLIITHEDYLKLGLMTAELSSNTSSTGTWTTIAGWLQQCSERHRCLSQIDPRWYPTRLVEVLSNDQFRIVRSDSKCFEPKGGYVTLSHRWGNSSDFVKLTRSNLMTFTIGRPVTELRKTFQDAIHVASRMAIPYLWIDSLCIIQSGDDGADWREESAKMAQVYSNSFCNISANGWDESSGLFFERTSPFEPPCELHMRWSLRLVPRSQLVNMPSLSPDGGLCHIVRSSGWSEDIMQSPLNHRGWVLQERQLASRILHFSPKGVSWECRVQTAWERTPLGFSDDEHAKSFGLLECATALSGMRRLRLHEPDVPVDWPRLVKQYTGCELTNQSDRLVAVAGLAKVLASTVKDQYVAGIWSKALPKALVWRTYVKRSCSPTTSYFTPSFSWAAAQGVVTWSSPCREILDGTSATFVQYREKPLSSFIDDTVRAKVSGQRLSRDLFGPITYPEVEVQIQGMLRSCRIVPRQLVLKKWFLARGDTCAYPSAEIEDSAIGSCFEKGTVFEIMHDRPSEKDAELDSITYYYTMISHIPTEPQELSASISYKSAEGILLKSIDSSMGRFERVGHITQTDLYNRPIESILHPLGNEPDLPAWSYDEATGRHTFYIV